MFREIAGFINNISSSQINGEPASKKRKFETDRVASAAAWEGEQEIIQDVSFGIPQRRKLQLELGKSSQAGLRTRNKDGEVDWAVKWADVQDVMMLPVPDKAQKQFNVCIWYKASTDEHASEHALFTILEGPPKPGTVSAQLAENPLNESIRSMINAALAPLNKAIVEPDAKEFVSPVPQPHRKNEPAYHIKAFRGAKEGYLHLLATGILWGFRKPLEFYPLAQIESVSYESILSHTFDLNIALHDDGDEPLDVKFGMLDQALFADIDAYVKAHDLHDTNMAIERADDDEDPANDATASVDEAGGELAKAARLAEEADGLNGMGSSEEEEDENFDPGSEGQSEGEGGSSSDNTDEE